MRQGEQAFQTVFSISQNSSACTQKPVNQATLKAAQNPENLAKF
jgi:hypothetical protein